MLFSFNSSLDMIKLAKSKCSRSEIDQSLVKLAKEEKWKRINAMREAFGSKSSFLEPIPQQLTSEAQELLYNDAIVPQLEPKALYSKPALP